MTTANDLSVRRALENAGSGEQIIRCVTLR